VFFSSSAFRAIGNIACRFWIPAFAGMTALILAAPVMAQTIQSEKHAFRVVTLTRGLQHPWSIAFLPDGRMLVTERAGRLRIVNRDFQLDPRPVEGLPEIVATGQGGLFDVALHPQYAQNGWIYWSYNAPGPSGWRDQAASAPHTAMFSADDPAMPAPNGESHRVCSSSPSARP